MAEEKNLRYAEPEIYKKMIEIFSANHIHPYDVQATIKKGQHGYELALKFPINHSQQMTTCLGTDKGSQFDEEVKIFFEKAAAVSKSLIMKDYYRMIKP